MCYLFTQATYYSQDYSKVNSAGSHADVGGGIPNVYLSVAAVLCQSFLTVHKPCLYHLLQHPCWQSVLDDLHIR